MKLDDFKKIVDRVRAKETNLNESETLWNAILCAGGNVIKNVKNANRHDKQDALSVFCVEFVTFRNRMLDNKNIDIFKDFSVESLFYAVLHIAGRTAKKYGKKLARLHYREQSLQTKITVGDETAELADVIPDERAAEPYMSGLARIHLRRLLNADDTETLVKTLGIKRREFCEKTQAVISARSFITVVGGYLDPLIDSEYLDEYYGGLLAKGDINIDRLYNKIYNGNRKTHEPHKTVKRTHANETATATNADKRLLTDET